MPYVGSTYYFVKKYIYNILNKDSNIDSIILGCTHYPIIIEKIRKYTPDNITLVTQGDYVAKSLKDYLMRHADMESRCTKNGTTIFLTTECINKFKESAALFLKDEDINVSSIILK